MENTLTKPKFRTPYDGVDKSVKINFLDEHGEKQIGRTKQCFKDTCDIKKIIQMHDKSGIILHVNKAKAEYGDFTVNNEFKENLDMVIKAQHNFDELPSQIRQEFNNDPGQFLEFVSNPENEEKMIKLGLANPKPIPYVRKVEVVNSPEIKTSKLTESQLEDRPNA